MLMPLWEAESAAGVSELSPAAAGVEERMGTRDVVRNCISFPSAGVRKVDSDELRGVYVSPGSLQVERRETEAGEEEEEFGGEEWLDACEEVEEEEEVQVESKVLGSSSEDGIHSHVSRSENLE